MGAAINLKLIGIQQSLKVPKGQTNTFGGYKYRNCEDILEAVKPMLAENAVVLTISDEIQAVGDRYYVKAIVTLQDIDSDESISVTAFAREEETKKGMDASQITGAASSYARKYALNGMFAIDDTKDADSQDNRQTSNRFDGGTPSRATITTPKAAVSKPVIAEEQLKMLLAKAKEHGAADKEAAITWLTVTIGKSPLEITKDEFETAYKKVSA